MSRKVTLALIAALVAATVGACAKPADESRVPARVVTVADLRAAPDTAAAAGSARFEIRLGTPSATGTAGGDVLATGGFAGQKVSVELDLASVLARAATTTPGASVPAGIDTTMRIIVDGASVYLQVPMLQHARGVDGWLSLSSRDLGSVGGSLGMSANLFDPSKMLEVLRGVAADLQVVGPEVVRGVAATHVRAVIDAAAPPAGAVDVWIDREGLVRRIQMVAHGLPASVTTGGADQIVTVDLFDYGSPVEITVPAASETTPFSDLLGSFTGVGT